ncbi:MAG: bifunctional adenosylcobinamide kinase/adenosylcobinamide-phosphate guanylyltransferase [Acidimicrobiales bacterium]
MIILVLGGARSGKSALAEQRAASSHSDVTYLATGADLGDDPDFTARIERHRARRPASWQTIEITPGGDLAGPLRSCGGTALVDSLGTWLAAIPEFAPDEGSLVAGLNERRAQGNLTVLVSDEVGLGVHPSTELGRRFRDALGCLNQAIAEIADEVVLAVAGRALLIPRQPS